MQRAAFPTTRDSRTGHVLTCPSPAPMTMAVGLSISFMPGPPLGPSYRITMTQPLNCGASDATAAIMSSSWSKQRAGPTNLVPSLPVILPTANSGARLPCRRGR